MKNIISLLLALIMTFGLGVAVSAEEMAVIYEKDVEYASIANIGHTVGGIGGKAEDELSAAMFAMADDLGYTLEEFTPDSCQCFSLELYPTQELSSIGFYLRGASFYFNRITIPLADFNVDQWNEINIRIVPQQTMDIYINDVHYKTIEDKNVISGSPVLRMSIAYNASSTGNIIAYMYNPHYSVEKSMPSDYTLPTVTLKSSSQTALETEEFVFTADAAAYDKVRKVDFYADGELIASDTSSPYQTSKRFEIGEHEIWAEVTDSYGKTAKSETLTVRALADTKPLLIMDLENEGVYERDELVSVNFGVKMTDASIKQGYVNIDGKKIADITEMSQQLDLSGLSLGVHSVTFYVINNYDESASTNIAIAVGKSVSKIYLTANYETSSGVSSFTNGRGFVRYEVLRDDFGKSILLGADQAYDTSLEGPWMSLDLGNCYTKVIAEFDLYVKDMRGAVQAMFADNFNNRANIFEIKNSLIYSGDGKQYVPFSADTWYRVRLDINMPDGMMDIYLNGEKAIEDYAINNVAGNAASWVRLISKLEGVPENYYALDNLTVTHVSEMPYIEKITSENGFADNYISSSDVKFKAYFTAGLTPVSVYPSKFSISDTDCKIISAVYNESDMSVEFELDKPLAPGKKYKLTVAENVVMGNGELYGEKLYADFESILTPVSVKSANITENGVLEAGLDNMLSTNQTVYVFTAAYKDGQIFSRSVKPVTLSAGLNSIECNIEGFQDADRVKAYVWSWKDIPYTILVADK